MKRVNLAIEENNPEEAQKALHKAIPLIQKARSKGILHRNTSARKISRLYRKVKSLKPQNT